MEFDIGKRVTQLREGKNMTVNKLADRAGLAQSSVRDIEMGLNTNPKLHTIEEICDVLEIKLCEFFNDSAKDPLMAEIELLTQKEKDSLRCFLRTLRENR